MAPLDTTALGSALAQSVRLSALVADLLDLSRLDAGVAALALEPVPVADLLSAAVDEARLTGRPMAYAVSVHPTDLTVEAAADVRAGLLVYTVSFTDPRLDRRARVNGSI